MKHMIFILLGAAVIWCIPGTVCSQTSGTNCGPDNLGFENGNLSGWEASRYDGCSYADVPDINLPQGSCPFPPCRTRVCAPCKDPYVDSQCPIQDRNGFDNYVNGVNAPINAPMTQCRNYDYSTGGQPATDPRFTLMTGQNFDPNAPIAFEILRTC